MGVEVAAMRTREELDDFVELSWSLYEEDNAFMPPLEFELRSRLSRRKNPYFGHADAELFVARRGGRPVGRISAQIDYEHWRVHREKTGFFGFFECIDDGKVAAALLGAAESWLRDRGCVACRGPFSFSINHVSGLLVDGFDTPPYVEMGHNPPYYERLIRALDYEGVMDLLAWRYDVTREVPELARSISETVARQPGLIVREVRRGDLDRDVRTVMDVFNEAWADNWGYVPLTEAEIQKVVDDLRLVIDPRLALIAEVEGEPAAIAVSIPNLNEALAKTCGRTRLRTAGRLLWELKVAGLETARLILLGVRRKFRGSVLGGLSVHLYVESHRRAAALGYREAELSWTLDDNEKINAGIRMMGGEPYKRYRVFERSLL